MKFKESPRLENVEHELTEIELRELFEKIIEKGLVEQLNAVMTSKTPVDNSTMDRLVTMYKTFVDTKLDLAFLLTDTYKKSREIFLEKLKSGGQSGNHRKLWNQQVMNFIKNYKLECSDRLRVELGLHEEPEEEKTTSPEKYDGRYGKGGGYIEHTAKEYD